MRKRLLAAGLGAIFGASAADAQQPQFPGPQQPTLPAQPLFPIQPPTPPISRFPAQPPAYVPPPTYVSPQFPATAPGGYVPGPIAPTQPPHPLPAALLPPLTPPAPGAVRPDLANPAAPMAAPAEVTLPQPEKKVSLSAMDVQVKRVIGGWQVWAGQRVIRDLGDNETNARDLARVYRDLRPTEWVTIGNGPKPVVEYGLTNGRPAATAAPPDAKSDPNSPSGPAASTLPINRANHNAPVVTGAGAKVIQQIDLRSARVEPIRGVWCVRDDESILLNFGTDKGGADQAVAAIRKYGFNRVGVVGDTKQPVMSYLFVSLDQDRPKFNGGQLFLNAQIDGLTRTGIPVPGVGYTGEMVKIDSRKVEARKDGTEWVVASESEILGRFGPTEWAAREAARNVQDAKFTEYCKLGGMSGLTFFLRDGKAPTRAPFSAQARTFDTTSLKVQQVNGKWAVTESNRHLFDVSSPQEGETVVRVLKAYGFDQIAHMTAGGPKGGVTFLVKNR